MLAAVHRHVAHSSFHAGNPGALAVDAVIEPCRGGEPQNILIPPYFNVGQIDSLDIECRQEVEIVHKSVEPLVISEYFTMVGEYIELSFSMHKLDRHYINCSVGYIIAFAFIGKAVYARLCGNPHKSVIILAYRRRLAYCDTVGVVGIIESHITGIDFQG